MIKMEIKKKQPPSTKESKLDITIDLNSVLLIGALFLASFLSTSHLSFLPDSLKSSSFTFSLAKTVLVFVTFLFFKNYLFVFE
jgi:hypothetical protein